MKRVQDNEHFDTADRLVLLIVSQPREGWESLFEEVTSREIERLYPIAEVERDG